jgi:predicted PurR-regulated permease PerM
VTSCPPNIGATLYVYNENTGNRVSVGIRPSRPQSSLAQLLLAAGAGGTLLYFAHAVFVPIALAILFSLLLSGPVEGLHERGVPRSVSASVILLLLLLLVCGAIYTLWTPAQSWMAMAPHTASVIQRKIEPAAKVVQRLEIASDRAQKLTQIPANTAAAPAAPANPAPPASSGVIEETRVALVEAATVVILTLFLLAAGPPVIARMAATFADNTHAAQVLLVYRAIRSELGRYYATIALINLTLGTATVAALWALRMPNPVLWGVLAGILNFIPYVGSAATFVILGLVAFVSFDNIGQILAIPGSYLALATIEGQIAQPLLVGHRLELNPIIVFLAVWLGGWFWGVPGIILAIPSLVALKVAAEHHKSGKSLVQFLSPGRVKSVPLRRKSAA